MEEEPKSTGDMKVSEVGKSEITHVKVEVAEFDQRIRNVEKFVDMVKNISDNAYQLGRDFLNSRTETDKRQQEYEDKQHRRGIWTLVFLVAVIFIFSMTALWQKEIDIVKFVLQSSLAVAAGTGITAIWKNRPRRKNKIDI